MVNVRKVNKRKAIIVNAEGKKLKTITGATTEYFWKHYNKYCKEKGYTQTIEGSQYAGLMAWSNGSDILELKWIESN